MKHTGLLIVIGCCFIGFCFVWADERLFINEKAYLLELTGFSRTKALCVISHGHRMKDCLKAQNEDWQETLKESASYQT
ncbi:hypothetical protein [Acetobacter orientalis]|uniref:hypothetical protein n=1 Tax=Acetobacter orientalis TaxID=146474 RepID=UPI00241C6387|nr:hypothetical protein [Acetobacter orientalis]